MMEEKRKCDKDFFAARGFDKPVGKDHANFVQRITFGWAAPLLGKGVRQQITEDTAEAFVDELNSAPYQAKTFEEAHQRVEVIIHIPYEAIAMAMLIDWNGRTVT
jgi:hypothetical protein